MRKEAKYDSPLWLLLPGHRMLVNKNPNLTKLPRLSSNDDVNTTAWGTLGGILSAGTLAAIITSAVNSMHRKKMEEASHNLRKTKIDALSATSIPREAYEEEDEEAKKKKQKDNVGVSKAASADWTTTAIPVGASVLAAIGAHKLIADREKDNYSAQLDTEIAKQREKLESLYAKLLKLYGSGNNFQLKKSAAAGKKSNPANDEPGVLSESIPAGTALLLAGLMTVPGLAAYYYTKKHSDELAKEKILKEQLLSANLTNIPDSILLQLDPHMKRNNA